MTLLRKEREFVRQIREGGEDGESQSKPTLGEKKRRSESRHIIGERYHT